MFLSPNINNSESINVIKNKIRNKEPFSFTRFGDGEIYVLNRNAYKHNNLEKRLCDDWGYVYPNEINKMYDELGKLLKLSLINTDLIGIMDSNNEIFNHTNTSYDPEIWSISYDYLSKLNINVNNLLVCDHMLSRSYELGNIDNLSKILNGSSVHIISPRTEIFKEKKLSEKLNCDITYTLHSNEINLNNRNEILENFKNIKEDIVLLGTGILKDYSYILSKKYNKIALDFGATMDAWAGLITRPWFKKGNIQDYLLIK